MEKTYYLVLHGIWRGKYPCRWVSIMPCYYYHSLRSSSGFLLFSSGCMARVLGNAATTTLISGNRMMVCLYRNKISVFSLIYLPAARISGATSTFSVWVCLQYFKQYSSSLVKFCQFCSISLMSCLIKWINIVIIILPIKSLHLSCITTSLPCV